MENLLSKKSKGLLASCVLLIFTLSFSLDVFSETYFVVFKDEVMSAQEKNTAGQLSVRQMRSGESISSAAERLFKEADMYQRKMNNRRAINKQNRYVNRFKKSYRRAIQGFSADLSDDAVEYLKKSPEVKYLAKDTGGRGNAEQSPVPSWGLYRIDQQDLPLDNSYEFFLEGTGVHAYVIDTGVRATHQQFVGRIGNGIDTYSDDNNPNDCHGHGTHVAGILGGATFGVAKHVTIHPVRVMDCNNSFQTAATVIDGIEWVIDNYQAPAVANLSLATYVPFQPLDDAVANLVEAGVTAVVAAGNNNQNACTDGSPAPVDAAITVGSVRNTDTRSGFSNFGNCVDIFAPGTGITSAWRTSNTAQNTISGTSMAAPHVAGVAAKILEANPNFSPAQVFDRIVSDATRNTLTNVGAGSPNLMLFTQDSLGGPTTVDIVVDNDFADGQVTLNDVAVCDVPWDESITCTVSFDQAGFTASFVVNPYRGAFASWEGCDSKPNRRVCTVNLNGGNKTINLFLYGE